MLETAITPSGTRLPGLRVYLAPSDVNLFLMDGDLNAAPHIITKETCEAFSAIWFPLNGLAAPEGVELALRHVVAALKVKAALHHRLNILAAELLRGPAA